MSSARWEDRSLVVRAEPGEVLEFHTDGVVTWPRGTRTDARWEHRFQIEPDGEGSRVAYRLRRTAITIPPLRMRVPVMRTLTHRVMIPLLCRRGFVNLVETAEQRATTPAQARASEPSPVAGSSPAGQLQAGRLYLIRPDGNVAASLPIDSGHVCDAGLRDALAAATAQLVSARFVTGG